MANFLNVKSNDPWYISGGVAFFLIFGAFFHIVSLEFECIDNRVFDVRQLKNCFLISKAPLWYNMSDSEDILVILVRQGNCLEAIPKG